MCFAKAYSHFKGAVFSGNDDRVRECEPNLVRDTLNYIAHTVRQLKVAGRPILYGTGLCCVPYLVEAADMVYLPSHFLVGVTSIEKLRSMLLQAVDQGYKCYAVVGYDSCLGKTLCAWIKFSSIPR